MVVDDEMIARGQRLAIYTDDRVDVASVTPFTPIKGDALIEVDIRQAIFGGPLSKFTVYLGELIGLELVKEMA